MKSTKNTVACISCDAYINVGAHPEIGQLLVCNQCDAELEIIDLDPLTLDWPMYEDAEESDEEFLEDEEEDFLDDDEDFFDDDDEDDDDDDY